MSNKVEVVTMTREELRQTIAEAVKIGVGLYRAENEATAEVEAKRLIYLRDLAEQNGYKGVEQYIKIAKSKRIPLTGKPYKIEGRYRSEFPKKVRA